MLYRLLICLLLLFTHSAVGLAGAIDIATESRNITNEMRLAAQQAADEVKAKADLDTSNSVVAQTKIDEQLAIDLEAKSEVELDNVLASNKQAQAKLIAEQAKVDNDKEKITEAEAANAAAMASVQQAESAELEGRATAEKAQAMAENARKAADLQQKTVENLVATESANAANRATVLDENNIDGIVQQADESAVIINAATEKADSAATVADQLTDVADGQTALVEQLEDAKSIAVDISVAAAEKLEDAKAIHSDDMANLADAKVTIMDMKVMVLDALTAVAAAKQSTVEATMMAKEAQNDLKTLLLDREESAKRGNFSFEWGNHYYSWQDNHNNKGQQFVQPYDFYYSRNKIEYGLSTAYVTSEGKNVDGTSGRVAAWSDTTLSIAHVNNDEKNPIRYSLGINVPTGKSALSTIEQAAIMDDDLVEKNTFGQGWDITPGLSIRHKIGKQDSWIMGTSYALRGAYDSGDVNGQMEPGDEWMKSLAWQHIDKKWQFTSEIVHTNFDTTRQGATNSYEQGRQLDLKLIYNKKLSEGQNLMFYYHNSNQQPYSYNNLVTPNDVILSHYLGFMWSKKNDPIHTFRLSGDVMKRSGNTVDPLTNLLSNERTRYSGGVGYDIELSPQQKYSIDIQKFYMKTTSSDGSNTNYDGYDLYLKYLYTF